MVIFELVKEYIEWVLILFGLIIIWYLFFNKSKKNIQTGGESTFDITFDITHDEEPMEICSISGETYTSTHEGWSDTSSWNIPMAYQGKCQNKSSLNETELNIITKFLYQYLDKKGFIASETNENYFLTKEGEEYIQNKIFPAIQEIIVLEITKTSPNHKQIAFFNHLVSLVGYDYCMKK